MAEGTTLVDSAVGHPYGATDTSFDIEATTSFQAISSQEHAAAAADVERDGHVEYNVGFPTYASKGGCMFCREAVPVTEKGKLIPDELEAGDHIATRGQICCVGLCYDHHAIVTKVTIDNGAAVIEVVDVNRKGPKCKRCTCEKCCDACWCCSCIQCDYPIDEHTLCDAAWGLKTGENTNRIVKTQAIDRFEYKNPRNTRAKTKEVARKCIGKKNNLQYNILKQNCENFATACVNGPDDTDAIKESISLQSRNCWWRLLHLFFWILQGSFYALNFCIYAVFVAKNEAYDIFSPGLHSLAKHLCYRPKNHVRGFDTTCDWMVILIFVFCFLVIFTISLCRCYQPLFTKGFICNQCLIIARLDCFSRIFTFVIFEGISVLAENPIYEFATKYNTGNWTYLIIVAISVIGALFVYSISSLVTWVLGMCCIPTCSGALEFSRYFDFRGLVWLFAWLCRCSRHLLCPTVRRRDRYGERHGYEHI